MNKFEITRRKDGEFQFNLKAKNGEIILTSEGYTTKENCKKGIESVRKNSIIDDRYDRKISTNGKPYFNLKASNGEIIGTSQLYASEDGRENGIESVKKNAKDAEIIDLTIGTKTPSSASETNETKKTVVKATTSELKSVEEHVNKVASRNIENEVEDEEIEEHIRPASASLYSNYGSGKKTDSYSTKSKKNCWSWLKYLLPLLALLLVLFFAWRSCNSCKISDNAMKAVTAPIEDAALKVEKTPVDVVLPNGTMLHAYKSGIEESLISFLQSDEYKNASDEDLKNKWFDFDNIDFKFASATEFAEGSEAQLQNVVEILKQFPNVKVKVGAYTDKVGGAESNMKLSGERAKTVKAIFDKAGIGNQIVDTEGYGDQFAKYSADAPDSERVLDRRIALRFVK